MKKSMTVAALAAFLFLSATLNAKEEKASAPAPDQTDQLMAAGLLESFLSGASEKVKFGGYLRAVLDGQFGKDTARQIVFEKSILDLLVRADPMERLSIFSHIEFAGENEIENTNAAWRTKSGFRNEIKLEIGTFAYHFSDLFVLTGGRFVSPFGIINVEHFEPVILMNSKPLSLGEVETSRFPIFDRDADGLQLSGSKFIGSRQSHQIGYSGYLFTSDSDPLSLGGGGRFFLNLKDGLVNLGVSNQTAQRGGQTYIAMGGDVKLRWKNFVVRSEFIRSLIEGASDQTSYYVQPAYGFFDGKLVLFAMLDYLDDPLGTTRVDHDQNENTASIADPIKHYRYTGGINYLPWTYLRARLEFHWHDYRGATAILGGLSRDYYNPQVSVVVSF